MPQDLPDVSAHDLYVQQHTPYATGHARALTWYTPLSSDTTSCTCTHAPRQRFPSNRPTPSPFHIKPSTPATHNTAELDVARVFRLAFDLPDRQRRRPPSRRCRPGAQAAGKRSRCSRRAGPGHPGPASTEHRARGHYAAQLSASTRLNADSTRAHNRCARSHLPSVSDRVCVSCVFL